MMRVLLIVAVILVVMDLLFLVSLPRGDWVCTRTEARPLLWGHATDGYCMEYRRVER